MKENQDVVPDNVNNPMIVRILALGEILGSILYIWMIYIFIVEERTIFFVIMGLPIALILFMSIIYFLSGNKYYTLRKILIYLTILSEIFLVLFLLLYSVFIGDDLDAKFIIFVIYIFGLHINFIFLNNNISFRKKIPPVAPKINLSWSKPKIGFLNTVILLVVISGGYFLYDSNQQLKKLVVDTQKENRQLQEKQEKVREQERIRKRQEEEERQRQAASAWNQGDTAYVFARNAGKSTWFDKEPLIYYSKVSVEQVNNSKVKVYIEKTCWKNAYGDVRCNNSEEGGNRPGSYTWVYESDLNSWPF